MVPLETTGERTCRNPHCSRIPKESAELCSACESVLSQLRREFKRSELPFECVAVLGDGRTTVSHDWIAKCINVSPTSVATFCKAHGLRPRCGSYSEQYLMNRGTALLVCCQLAEAQESPATPPVPKETISNEPLLTVEEVSNMLGLTGGAIGDLARRGYLNRFRSGARYVYTLRSVEALLEIAENPASDLHYRTRDIILAHRAVRKP